MEGSHSQIKYTGIFLTLARVFNAESEWLRARRGMGAFLSTDVAPQTGCSFSMLAAQSKEENEVFPAEQTGGFGWIRLPGF